LHVCGGRSHKLVQYIADVAVNGSRIQGQIGVLLWSAALE